MCQPFTQVSYGTAVTAVLFTGLFFVILSVSGVRGKLIKSMPKSLLFAITAGIGMFLTHLGLQQADGLGIVTYQSATLVTMGRGMVLLCLLLFVVVVIVWITAAVLCCIMYDVCIQQYTLVAVYTPPNQTPICALYIGICTYRFPTYNPMCAGGCPRDNRVHQYTIADPSTVCALPPGANASEPIVPDLGPPSSNYACRTYGPDAMLLLLHGGCTQSAHTWHCQITGNVLMCVLTVAPLICNVLMCVLTVDRCASQRAE